MQLSACPKGPCLIFWKLGLKFSLHLHICIFSFCFISLLTFRGCRAMSPPHLTWKHLPIHMVLLVDLELHQLPCWVFEWARITFVICEPVLSKVTNYLGTFIWTLVSTCLSDPKHLPSEKQTLLMTPSQSNTELLIFFFQCYSWFLNTSLGMN